ncbi:cytidylate kinase [Candidatus Woesearchaeota archaeon]|nr:cytidylate kinase [Candidatus Woesearchaeota archaeon]|tara:strand:- start:39925 stop:40464 length:540 start_codon:yes stop_codon:yes gene_type:complete
MIITISGDAGSGKSTVAEIVSKKLKYKHYSVGDFMRIISRKRGLTLLQVSELAEKDESIDEELDDMQIELGKFEDHFVLDSRLGFHFVPKSLKVFLKVDVKEAAKRIFNHKRRLEEENKTLEATLENIKKRKKSELHRYKKYYNLNPYDKKNYDLVIDTTNNIAEQTADEIIKAVKNNK